MIMVFVVTLLPNILYCTISQYKSQAELHVDQAKNYPIRDACCVQSADIYCDNNACYLVCMGKTGIMECSWSTARLCQGCDVLMNHYNKWGGAIMPDYANDKIDMQIYQGNYTFNTYELPLGKTIYRTVHWYCDFEEMEYHIDITLSDGIQ